MWLGLFSRAYNQSQGHDGYNFLNSCFSELMMGKMMNLVGAKELWHNFRHTKNVQIKDLGN